MQKCVFSESASLSAESRYSLTVQVPIPGAF